MGRSTSEHIARDNSKNDEGTEFHVVPSQGTDATRIIVLNGEVNENTVSAVIVQLLYLASQARTPIHLIVSTYGGSVDEMFSLYDTIKFLPCPVHTVALGKVMSAGVLLLAAGEKGSRQIGRNARVMMHPVWGESTGNVFEQLNSAIELKRHHDQLVEAMISETSMSKERINDIMKMGHNYYLTAAEAIELGIVDKYIGT